MLNYTSDGCRVIVILHFVPVVLVVVFRSFLWPICRSTTVQVAVSNFKRTLNKKTKNKKQTCILKYHFFVNLKSKLMKFYPVSVILCCHSLKNFTQRHNNSGISVFNLNIRTCQFCCRFYDLTILNFFRKSTQYYEYYVLNTYENRLQKCILLFLV